jgi:hypothetical protein
MVAKKTAAKESAPKSGKTSLDRIIDARTLAPAKYLDPEDIPAKGCLKS